MATKKTSVTAKKTTKKTTSTYSLKKHGEAMLKLSKQPMSALLRLAVNDVKKVEKLKGVELDMSIFFGGKTKATPCAVCMAGSVLLCDVKMPKTGETAFPEFAGEKAVLYSQANYSVLESIDMMRKGCFHSVAIALGIKTNDLQYRAADLATDIVQETFGEGPVSGMATYESYEAAAKVLEAVGL